jgi:predicted MFS family arabinose efflux permease
MNSFVLSGANQPSVWLGRLAVSTLFFASGFLFANWAARIPDVQVKLALSEAGLGLVLIGYSVGFLSTLPFAGGLIERLGSRIVTVGAGGLQALFLPLMGLAPAGWVLFVGLVGFGVAGSLKDIATNAQALEVERRFGRSIISGMHALFSLGLAFGALISTRLIALPLPVHFGIVAAAVVMVCALMWYGLTDIEGERTTDTQRFSLPPRALWPVGVVVFCGVIAESSLVDWSVKYMRDVVQVDAATATHALMAFSLMMMVGRFGGDSLVSRFNKGVVVRMGGILAAGGVLLVVAFPNYSTVLIGLGIAGLGVATAIPLAFSAAGNTPGVRPGAGIAGVATIGYSGIFIGPPLVGSVAQVSSLRVSFAIIAALLLLMAMVAMTLRRR